MPAAEHSRSSRQGIAPSSQIGPTSGILPTSGNGSTNGAADAAEPSAKSAFSPPRLTAATSSARRISAAPPSERRFAAIGPPMSIAARHAAMGPVVCGRAGDHPDVYQLLLAVFQGPSREEFYASQDEPSYDPGNRLLIRHNGRLVAHLQLIRRTMGFGPLRLPVDRLAWLATLPEFRSQGVARALLNVAATGAAANGAASRNAGDCGDGAFGADAGEPIAREKAGPPWGLLRTRIPRFFHRWGWAVCGRHSRSRARARNILARYWADPALRTTPLNIRLWRHVELSALMRIYARNTIAAFGPPLRSEAYWRWLISRKAFDHIVVAIAGPDKLELDEASAPIVGYAVVRQKRIVELLTDPAYPHAGPQLLARACSDAIERDQQEIELEAPPSDPLHRFVAAADGQFFHREMEEQEVFMVRRPAVAALVRCVAPLWESRLRESGMSRACELGLLVGQEKHLLTVARRGTRSIPGRLSRNYIACSSTEFTRLVMGHSNPTEAADGGRLTASTQVALELAGILFPRIETWHPAWDDLAC
ncbi:MAG TPA: GNAT family N-acetyltransferase [Pirellulales bacterium]|nr:GNAT family N-acetyltransferase [Pirellulales bacterium]